MQESVERLISETCNCTHASIAMCKCILSVCWETSDILIRDTHDSLSQWFNRNEMQICCCMKVYSHKGWQFCNSTSFQSRFAWNAGGVFNWSVWSACYVHCRGANQNSFSVQYSKAKAGWDGCLCVHLTVWDTVITGRKTGDFPDITNPDQKLHVSQDNGINYRALFTIINLQFTSYKIPFSIFSPVFTQPPTDRA